MDSLRNSTTTSQSYQPEYRRKLDTQSNLTNEKTVSITIHEEVQLNPHIVDWDGPEDTANPLNWSSRKKLAAMGIVSLNTLLS